MQELVSVITPCYNGEAYISRFLDSILNQDYSNIELIIIDDGSVDSTADIIFRYQSRFLERGYTIEYIYQKNNGQASALNKGFKIFKGKYLTWPDSDDILNENSITNKVEFLLKNSEYGCVRTDLNIVNEGSVSNVVIKASDKISFENEAIFDDFIFEKNVYFCPGSYMVKRAVFIDAIPSGQIYESRAGQNWQILLPIFLKYKCGYLNQSLYTYVIRKGSHSHSITKFDDEIIRCDEHLDILLNVLATLDVNLEQYKELLIDKYLYKKFYIACRHGNIGKAKYFYKANKNSSISDLIKLMLLISKLYKLCTVVINQIRKLRK